MAICNGEEIMGILALIITVPLSCVMIYRVLYSGGLQLGADNRILKHLTWKTKEYAGCRNVGIKKVIFVGLCAVLLRLFVYFISILITKLIYMGDESLLELWNKWDANAYIGIASGGYARNTIDGVANMGDGVMNTLVFFPLYPVLAAAVKFITGNVQMALLITSTLCFAAGCIVLYMAVSYRYGEGIASKAVILLASNPFAFYQGAMLPESTFILVCALCMYFTFKKKWLLAGIMGVFCALARLQGVIIIAFIGLEWLEDKRVFELIKNKDWKAFRKSLINLPAIFMPLTGVIIYIAVNYLYTGDAFYFMKLQKNVWAHSFTNIVKAVDGIWNYFVLANERGGALRFTVWGPELILIFGILLLMYFTLKKHSIGMTLYLLLYLIISFSSDYVISGTRYMSVAVVLFVLLAEISERRRVVFWSLVCGGSMLQVIYMACYVSGWHLVT